jgi:hypothetical protein
MNTDQRVVPAARFNQVESLCVERYLLVEQFAASSLTIPSKIVRVCCSESSES